jgi:hypothetical protein
MPPPLIAFLTLDSVITPSLRHDSLPIANHGYMSESIAFPTLDNRDDRDDIVTAEEIGLTLAEVRQRWPDATEYVGLRGEPCWRPKCCFVAGNVLEKTLLLRLWGRPFVEQYSAS